MKSNKISIVLFLFIPFLLAAHLHKEKDYQNAWCSQNNGITEYRLDDSSRIDCLTDEYAIEFDFAPKWAEAVGQALYYAEKTGKKAGIALIIETDTDTRFIKKLLPQCDKYDIALLIITPLDIDKHK